MKRLFASFLMVIMTATSALTFGFGTSSGVPWARVQSGLDLKANLASPVFTGTLTAPIINIPTGGVLRYNSVAMAQANTGFQNWFFGGAGNLTMTGGDNLGFGQGVLGANTTGNYNTGAGSLALNENETSSENSAFGGVALRRHKYGDMNSSFGSDGFANQISGESNTGIGWACGFANISGARLTMLGAQATVLATNLTNASAVGYGSQVGSSDTMVFGATDGTAPKPRFLFGSTTKDNFGGNFDIRFPYQSRAGGVPAQLFVADNGASQVADTGGAIDFGGYDATFSRAYSYARIQGLADSSVAAGGYLSLMVQNGGAAIVEAARLDKVYNLRLGGATIGTDLIRGIAIAAGNPASTSPADVAQLVVTDINAAAGKAGLHLRNENTGNLIVNGTLIKTDTGDPAYNHEALICINTFDNNVKIYADGAWRTIASW